MSSHAIWRTVQRKFAPDSQAARIVIEQIVENGKRQGDRIRYGGMIAVLEEDRVVTVYADETKRRRKRG